MMTSADSRDDAPPHDDPAVDIEAVNSALSQWAARSATESEGLIERLEALGYEIRGKSEDEIADILRRPPTRHRR